jgi:hypothetical protein
MAFAGNQTTAASGYLISDYEQFCSELNFPACEDCSSSKFPVTRRNANSGSKLLEDSMLKTTSKNQLPVKLVCLLAIALLAPLAHASILGNGSSAPPSPLFPTGTQVAYVSGTITTATFSATYQQWVYADPTNTWCSGCLDFVYQFTNNGGDANERFSMYNFAGFLVDAGTHVFGVHDPMTIDRSLLGPVVAFNYGAGNEIVPGETTPLLVIETNALHFKPGFASAQDGTAGYGFAYAPSAVPEPSSLALVGGGLSVFGFLLRKVRIGMSV